MEGFKPKASKINNIHEPFFFQEIILARQFWPGRFLEQLGAADLYLSEYREFLSTIREGFSSLSGWRGSFTSSQSFLYQRWKRFCFFRFCSKLAIKHTFSIVPQIALAIGVLTSSIGVKVRRFFGLVLGGLSGRVSSEVSGAVGQGVVNYVFIRRLPGHP